MQPHKNDVELEEIQRRKKERGDEDDVKDKYRSYTIFKASKSCF